MKKRKPHLKSDYSQNVHNIYLLLNLSKPTYSFLSKYLSGIMSVNIWGVKIIQQTKNKNTAIKDDDKEQLTDATNKKLPTIYK